MFFQSSSQSIRRLAKHYGFVLLNALGALMVMVGTAIAQGGGGGGGGSSGGGSGSSGGGGSYGGGSYGGYSSYGNDGYSSGSSDDSWVLWAIVLALIYLFSFLTKSNGETPARRQSAVASPSSRQKVANVVLILRDGASYVSAINRLTQQANFETFDGRRAFLRQLANAIQPEDVVEGFVRTMRSNSTEGLWRSQKSAAEIQNLVINVAPPNRSPTQWDREPEAPAVAATDTYCIVGILITDEASQIAETVELGSIRAIVSDLSRYLSSYRSAFYYYFGPNTTGVSLGEAQRLLEKVRQYGR